jgi:hypothetical protein
MSCGVGCGGSGSSLPGFPEYIRPWKPENNAGCCCGGSRGCDTASLARPGSALAAWEKVHGKVYTNVWFELDTAGRTVQRVEKKTCPVETPRASRHGCCSVRYRPCHGCGKIKLS